jgi:hypothetical protein
MNSATQRLLVAARLAHRCRVDYPAAAALGVA